MDNASTIRNRILASRDYQILEVEVPEWNHTTVFVRTLSLLEAIAFEVGREEADPAMVTALYLTFALCDGDGTPIYSQSPADLDELAGKRPETISRLFNLAADLANPPAPAGGEAEAEDAAGK